MHRFYQPPSAGRRDRLELAGREAHHALRVLRLQPGERLVVLDGAGHESHCLVEKVSRDSLELKVWEQKFTPAPPCAVTLIVAVPKGKIIEQIIQKSVELGAHRVAPLLTDRVITQLDGEGAEQKREKWRQVAC